MQSDNEAEPYTVDDCVNGIKKLKYIIKIGQIEIKKLNDKLNLFLDIVKNADIESLFDTKRKIARFLLNANKRSKIRKTKRLKKRLETNDLILKFLTGNDAQSIDDINTSSSHTEDNVDEIGTESKKKELLNENSENQQSHSNDKDKDDVIDELDSLNELTTPDSSIKLCTTIVNNIASSSNLLGRLEANDISPISLNENNNNTETKSKRRNQHTTMSHKGTQFNFSEPVIDYFSPSWFCPHSSEMHWDAEAIHDFEAMEDDEISFNTGMKFHLTYCEDGMAWWRAIIGNKIGLIPSNFVRKTPSKVNNLQIESTESTEQEKEIELRQVNKLLEVYDDVIFTCESIYAEQRDYNRAVKITVMNHKDNLALSIDVLKVLIMLKLNNIFLNICSYDDISLIRAIRHNNNDVYSNLRAAEFVITFEQPLSSYYFQKFNKIKLTESNTKLIPKEHMDKVQFQLFR